MSISLVNQTLGVDEKIVVHPAACTLALALHLQSRCKQSQSGGQKQGLKGRTFDLKWAFKQLGVADEDLAFSKVVVWCPAERRPVVVSLKALPFGATGSVHGFCRCSLALWHIATSFLLLPLTVFFDDFTSVCLAEDTVSAEASMLLLFKLMGWQAALTGSKASGFAECFVSLGIAYLLPKQPGLPVSLQNTEARRKEVATTCLRALHTDTFSPAESLAFAGRLRWLDAQTFGRVGRIAFRTILQHGMKPGRRAQTQLTTQLRDALTWVLENVPNAQPRAFHAPKQQSVNVFTDGSFEQGVGQMGGVLCDSTGWPKEWFQASVPPDVLRSWGSDGTVHPILQCELLAVSIAAMVWGPQLSRQNVTWWIDNDAARHCLISAKGYPESNRLLVQAVLVVEYSHEIHSWFARVPSISNPADAPSRGEQASFLSGAKEEEIKVGWLRCLARGAVPRAFLQPTP